MNKEHFQGNINNKNYFEGWYFKQVTNDKKKAIAFIVGISTSKPRHSFIQIITNKESHYLKFDINDFTYSKEPFFIKIKENYFSKEHVILDINNDELALSGLLIFHDLCPLKTNVYRPTIMGPFSYIPNMECNHGILSLDHKVNGTININNNRIEFNDGYGYIEKDYGTSFPKYYTWLQSNCPTNSKDACIFVSIADIPIYKTSFRGLISVLKINNKQYFFTSYYLSKVRQYEKDGQELKILLKNMKYYLEIIATYDNDHYLLAPNQGEMNHVMKESIDAKIKVKLKDKKKHVIFSDTFVAGGFENVKR